MIENIRKYYCISQEEMGTYLHKSQSSYSRIEKQVFYINIKELIYIAFLFDVSINYLLGISSKKDYFSCDDKETFLIDTRINVQMYRKLRNRIDTFDRKIAETDEKTDEISAV